MMFVSQLQNYKKKLTPQAGASPNFNFSRFTCACILAHARHEVLADNNSFYIVFTVAVLLGGIYGAAALRDASERHRAQQEKERMEDYRKQQRLLREQEEAERRRREQRIAELYAQDKTIQKHLNELKELYDEAEEFHWFRLPSEKERQLRTLREKRDAYLEDRRAIRLELQSLGEDVELI